MFLKWLVVSSMTMQLLDTDHQFCESAKDWNVSKAADNSCDTLSRKLMFIWEKPFPNTQIYLFGRTTPDAADDPPFTSGTAAPPWRVCSRCLCESIRRSWRRV